MIIASTDYHDLFVKNDNLSNYGTINPKKSFVSEIQIENSIFPVVNIIIERDNIVIGTIVAVRLDSNQKKKMTTGHEYAIVLCDTRDFDVNTQTGIYRVYDANYDFFMACEIESIDNMITGFNGFPMPGEIAKKYEFRTGTSKAHPCDSSQDGNISLGECYVCLKKAISSDATLEFMCDALDIGGLCFGSIAVACVLISSIR